MQYTIRTASVGSNNYCVRGGITVIRGVFFRPMRYVEKIALKINAFLRSSNLSSRRESTYVVYMYTLCICSSRSSTYVCICICCVYVYVVYMYTLFISSSRSSTYVCV